MNWKIYTFLLGILVFLNACSLETAKPIYNELVTVYCDEPVLKDKRIIQQIRKTNKLNVRLVFKTKQEIAQEVHQNKYNVGFDVLITSSDSLRNALKEAGLFQKFEIKADQNIQRQFYNNHLFWTVICHDPLLVVSPKDSLHSCKLISISSLKNDSVSYVLKAQDEVFSFYQSQLKRSQLTATKQPYFIPGQVFFSPLSEVLKSKSKSKFYCYFYLISGKKYLTRTTTISIYKYCRNAKLAKKFIQYYSAYAYQIAANRNQLSSFQHIVVNNDIHDLNIMKN